MLSFLTQVLQKLFVFVERRRASGLAAAALLLLFLGVTGVFVVRPPVLVPVLDVAAPMEEDRK